MTYKFKIDEYSLPDSGELNLSNPTWQLDWSRAMLLVHDMQEYFIKPIPDRLRIAVTTNTSTLVRLARVAGAAIAYTGQPGRMNFSERGLLQDFWGEGMSSTEQDRKIIEAVNPQPNDLYLTKWRYSAYTRTALAAELTDRKKDQLVICGVYSHVGILATALDSLARDIQCFVVADAIADFSKSYHITTLQYIAERCGKVIFMENLYGQQS